jgi:hypothetical protein
MLRNIRELSDGSLIIPDMGEYVLYAVEFDEAGGSETRELGRSGQGPGEYQRPMWVYPLGGDSSLVADGGARRWFILDGTDIVETRTETDGPLRFHLEFDGTTPTQGLTYRGFVYAPDAMPFGYQTADSMQPILLREPWNVRANGEAIDTFGIAVKLRGGGAGGINGCARVVGARRRSGQPEVRTCRDPIQGEDRALLFDDGWIAVAYLSPFRVDWRRPDGSWIRGEPVDEPEVRMNLDERCAAAQGWNYRGMGRCTAEDLEDFVTPPEYLPFVRESSGKMSLPHAPPLIATPEGRLLVRRTPTSRTFMFSRYDVFDRTGVRVGRIQLSASEAILGFGPESVYTVRTDEFDLHWIRRHVWAPSN